MGIRYGAMIAGVIGASACQAAALDVGTNDAGSTSGSVTGSTPGSTNVASSGNVEIPPQSECDAGLSTGAGFTALTPTECGSAIGPVHAVTSASDVTVLLIGQWISCGVSILGEGGGIQFTADGRFSVLTSSDDSSLVVGGSPGTSGASGAAGTSGASGAAGSSTGTLANSPGGTFSVVDGSATYGAGTFALHLNPDSGGFYEGQITITDSPRAFSFQAPNTQAVVYTLPAPWTPRANVCSACTDSTPPGTPIDGNDAGALVADVVGSWLWCGGAPLAVQLPTSNLVVGVEFTADGAWYWLVEAHDGTLSRDPAPAASGTYTFAPSIGGAGPNPLGLVLSSPNLWGYTQAVVTQNPRGFWLEDGNDGYPVTADSFTYLSPIPNP